MRRVLAGLLVAAAATGAGGQEAKKAEPRYDTVKELDKKAKAALEVVRKREDGYLDKGIAAFGEVVTRADPRNVPAQRVAGQAAYFLNQLYVVKEAAAYKEFQLTGGDDQLKALERVRADRELWGKAAPTNFQDVPALTREWQQIQRAWALDDLKKK